MTRSQLGLLSSRRISKISKRATSFIRSVCPVLGLYSASPTAISIKLMSAPVAMASATMAWPRAVKMQ